MIKFISIFYANETEKEERRLTSNRDRFYLKRGRWWRRRQVTFIVRSFDDRRGYIGLLSATKHLYNWLCPSVGLSVCLSVTHSFDDPNVAPYWPTWSCFLVSRVYSLFYEFSINNRQPYLLCNRMKFMLLCLFYLHLNTRPNSPTPQLPLPFHSSASMTKSLLQKQYAVISTVLNSSSFYSFIDIK